MNLLEFLSDNLPSDYEFKLTNEVSYVFDKDKDNIIIRLAQGDRYARGVVQPLTMLVTTKNVNRSLEIWNNFVKAVSDKDYPDGTENVYMMFQTPYTSQLFDEVSNNFYHTVTIFGTLVLTEGVLDIKSVEIDGIKLEVNTAVYQLINNPSSEQLSVNGWLNETEIQNTVITLQLVTFLLDYGSLSTKLKRQRKGQASPNADFNIKIEFVDGDVEEHTMKLTTQSISKTRGAMSLLSLNFTR